MAHRLEPPWPWPGACVQRFLERAQGAIAAVPRLGFARGVGDQLRVLQRGAAVTTLSQGPPRQVPFKRLNMSECVFMGRCLLVPYLRT